MAAGSNDGPIQDIDDRCHPFADGEDRKCYIPFWKVQSRSSRTDLTKARARPTAATAATALQIEMRVEIEGIANLWVG